MYYRTKRNCSPWTSQRERGGYYQFKPLFYGYDKPTIGFATLLKWLPSVNLLHLLNKKPQWCEVAQLRQEAKGPSSTGKDHWLQMFILQLMERRKVNFLSPYLQEPFSATFCFFEISSEDAQFNTFQLRYLQALGNSCLETKIKQMPGLKRRRWEMLLWL